jgi:hypothetical protein
MVVGIDEQICGLLQLTKLKHFCYYKILVDVLKIFKKQHLSFGI